MKNIAKPLLAECIGAFALIFIGVLSISAVNIVQAPNGLANLASIGLGYGLTVAVMMASLGAVSGGHFNPAVTAAFMATGRISPLTGVLYVVAQLVGASAAAFTISALFGQTSVGASTPLPAPQVSATSAIIVEIIATFLLVFVFFGTAIDARAPKAVFPFAVGLASALIIMAIAPLTGGAANPARAFGPALASGVWTNHLVYWVGPIIGGVLAGLVQNFVFLEHSSSSSASSSAD